MKSQTIDRPLILKNQKSGGKSPNLRLNESGELAVCDFSFDDLKLEIEKLKLLKAQFIRGKWSGEDVGSEVDPIANIHSKGEAKGLRLQNSSGLPQSSGKSVGRVLFNTQDNAVYCDVGSKFKKLSSEKFERDVQVSNPSEAIVLDLSGIDATRAVWQVCDNGNDFARVNAKIKTPDAKKVVIELPMGCAVGTYRILGVE